MSNNDNGIFIDFLDCQTQENVDILSKLQRGFCTNVPYVGFDVLHWYRAPKIETAVSNRQFSWTIRKPRHAGNWTLHFIWITIQYNSIQYKTIKFYTIQYNIIH